MSTRHLPAVVMALVVGLLASCTGESGGLASDAPDEIVEQWVDVVCADDPVQSDDAPLDDRAVRYLECTPIASTDLDDDVTASLTVFDDAASAESGVEEAVSQSDSCDVAYSLVAGPRWISRLDDGWRVNALVKAGAEVICEGR